MKKSHLVILGLAAALTAACQNQKSESTTEEVAIEAGTTESIPGNYGAELEVAGVVSPAEMILVVEKEGNFEGKIAGEIKEVCTKKGCLAYYGSTKWRKYARNL